jgi:hypothetical protein
MKNNSSWNLKQYTNRTGNEEGAALIMVMLFSMLFLGLGLALSINTTFEMDITANKEREVLAFYAAQTGLERTIDSFRTNYTIDTIPENGAVLFNQSPVQYPGSNLSADYTITVERRDSPIGSAIHPFPIFYTLRSVGRWIPANPNVRASSVTLCQTVSVSPRTLANYTLFYDEFSGGLAFQSTFRLTGRLAINDLNGVNAYPDTNINGDFYSAGPINRNPPYGVPEVSGDIVENGGKIDFPDTIDPFSNGAEDDYQFEGTTRMIFSDDGTVTVYNANLPGGQSVMDLPENGLIAVTEGDVIVEGTVNGRVTVTCDDDILLNGDIRYADQSPNSSDTAAFVAEGDVVIPTEYYTATDNLEDFEPVWNGGRYLASSIDGGVWGEDLPADIYLDATLVSLTGSSPTVINPRFRPPGQMYLYGNSISKSASVTVRMSGDTVLNGLNENYTENKKLDILPPPGFPTDTKLMPTFFDFHEMRTAVR